MTQMQQLLVGVVLIALHLTIGQIGAIADNGYVDSIGHHHSAGQALTGGSGNAAAAINSIASAFPATATMARYSPYWQATPTALTSYGVDPSLPSPLPANLPAVITPMDALLLGVLAACGVSLVGVPMLALLGLINPFNSAGAGLKSFRVMPPTAITTVQANSPLTPSASSIIQTTAEIKDGDSAAGRKFEKRHADLGSWKRIAENLERLVRAQNALRSLKNVG